mmetsp:Transcript_84316/g.168819  ORF Transcript_84316/g.168819 Transcript_84316/m.168819 type:complete len:333 (+) Transcript_84316:83-1081(+)
MSCREEISCVPVLVLLMGIPGAGKSTIATRLLEEQTSENASLQVVCYDDLFEEETTFNSDDNADDSFDPERWHKSRSEALGRASALLAEGTKGGSSGTAKKGQSSSPKKNSKNKGKAARSSKLPPDLTTLLESDPLPPDRSTTSNPSSTTTAAASAAVTPPPPPPPKQTLKKWICAVVLDDTFHLRSMRREARRVARRAGAGLVVVWVDCPLNECLARNALRLEPPLGRRVPEASLRKTFDSLQPPRRPLVAAAAAAAAAITITAAAAVAGRGAGRLVRHEKSEAPPLRPQVLQLFREITALSFQLPREELVVAVAEPFQLSVHHLLLQCVP